MRFLSLFAGIGGFDLGLERAGMECAGQVEIDPFCLAVLATHWPNVKRLADIREVEGDEFGPVDVICGGFPCQPWSVAGKRGGTQDDRDLWPEMRRIIGSVRPRWVVGENVPGLDDSEFMGLDRVLSDLEGLDYQTVPIEIPACAVDAPHKRSRLWIVAHGGHAESSGRDDNTRGSEGFACHELAPPGDQTLAHGARDMQPEQAARGTDGERVGAGGDEAVAHGAGQQAGAAGQPRRRQHVEHAEIVGRGEGWAEPELRGGRPTVAEPGGAMGHAIGAGLAIGEGLERDDGEKRTTAERTSHWSDAELVDGRRVGRLEPGFGRVDDGLSPGLDGLIPLLAKHVPRRVDRLRALGNAVVPQIVERVGWAIMEAER